MDGWTGGGVKGVSGIPDLDSQKGLTLGLFAGLGLGLGFTIGGILFCCTFHNIFKLDTHCT